MSDREKMEELYLMGLEAYHKEDYFDAHEYWEDLWSDYYFDDRKFIQGLVQLSVSFFHLQNDNLNGAKGLMHKSIEKFDGYNGLQRNIDVDHLKEQMKVIQKHYNCIKSTSEFDWDLIPELI